MNDPVMDQIQKSLDAMYAQGYQDALSDARNALMRITMTYNAAGQPVPATPPEGS